MARWTLQIRKFVVIGRVPDARDDEERDSGCRWISWDAPWTEDVRLYDCPMRLHYFGRRWCWVFGARSQCYDWKRSIWGDTWKRFVVYPRDHRQRYERTHTSA